MCLARLFRLMDLRTRYTRVFSALASGRSASWAKLVMGETRGYPMSDGHLGSTLRLFALSITQLPSIDKTLDLIGYTDAFYRLL